MLDEREVALAVLSVRFVGGFFGRGGSAHSSQPRGGRFVTLRAFTAGRSGFFGGRRIASMLDYRLGLFECAIDLINDCGDILPHAVLEIRELLADLVVLFRELLELFTDVRRGVGGVAAHVAHRAGELHGNGWYSLRAEHDHGDNRDQSEFEGANAEEVHLVASL